jgi:hypothetical protein
MDAGILTMKLTIGLVKVKKDDFKQGFAQATVQMELSLGRKREANEIDDEYGLKKYGDCNRCGKMVFHRMYARQ